MPNTMEFTGSNLPTFSLLATPYAWLTRLLAPCDDYWTWMTRDGSIYEEVDVVQLEAGMVTFRHRHGTSRVRVCDLSPAIQKSLYEANDQVAPEVIEPEPISFVLHSLSRAG